MSGNVNEIGFKNHRAYLDEYSSILRIHALRPSSQNFEFAYCFVAFNHKINIIVMNGNTRKRRSCGLFYTPAEKLTTILVATRDQRKRLLLYGAPFDAAVKTLPLPLQ